MKKKFMYNTSGQRVKFKRCWLFWACLRLIDRYAKMGRKKIRKENEERK